jgi:hypothetical protein
VRHAADVVFMAVRQHEGGDAPFLLQIRHVRNDAIDAQQFRIRKHDAGIDDDGRLTPGERHHVHPELTDSAEWNDFEHSEMEHRPTPDAVPGGTNPTKRLRAAAQSGCWARLNNKGRMAVGRLLLIPAAAWVYKTRPRFTGKL